MTDIQTQVDDADQSPLSADEIAAHNSALVGFHYTVDDYYEVGREEVRKHAFAVQDDNPVHWNEATAKEMGHDTLIAAPTFVSVLGLVAQRKLFQEHITGYEFWQIMQSDQRLQYHQPIKVGDQLVCDVSLDSFRQVAGTDVMVTKNVIWNQYDEPVMTTWTGLVARASVQVDPELLDVLDHVMIKSIVEPGGGRTVERPEGRYDLPDPQVDPKPYSAISFDDLTVGQQLPTRVFTLTRGNLVNYAGVAYDPNPIHFSDTVARAAGLDDVVAQGMQTMGLGGSYIGGFVGDPAAFYEYNVRFTSPVYVPAAGFAEVEFTGKIKSLDPETRRGQIAIVAKQDGRKIFGRATANVQFN
ncbi:fused (3R)-hydroxyacyl-ACP dehydratase subunits HadA/HadB [Williamsia sterculiae]|uniref:Acyl dehydratase n=1 Tax=Williamsia sterculiae TaxID=1344003 RepID=A0A1N7D323_9NOCA|nr:fused (3R)-hydroxyacyl-ACP dehydratase subunits HadA/HadB [Williamsia sterculiae]SIR70276.1 Acyl dehydratase [Williamsia sterculiae]